MNIGVVAWKGGVGKTFIASHLIFGLAEKGYKVAGIDLDSQGDLMKWVTGYKWRGEESYNVNEKIYLMWKPAGEFIVPSADFVIFDGRPQVEITSDILQVLDVALIPFSGRMSLINAANIRRLQKEMSPYTKLFLVENFYQPPIIVGQQEEKLALEDTDIPILDIKIPRTVRVREAELYGKPVWEIPYAERGKCPEALRKLCDFVIKMKEELKNEQKA